MPNHAAVPRHNDRAMRQKWAHINRIGWQDGWHNAPFANLYETADILTQRNYEQSRLRAINVRTAGLAPITWRPGVQLPQGYRQRLERAKDLVGSCQVSTIPLPDDPTLSFTRPHLNRRGFPLPVPTYCER